MTRQLTDLEKLINYTPEQREAARHLGKVVSPLRNVTVMLTDDDLDEANKIGTARRVASWKQRNTDRKHSKESAWGIEISGCAAEIAVARFLQVPWPRTVNTFKLPDLPGLIQVRSTTYNDGRLFFRPGDDESHLYVLVITRLPNPRCTLIGALVGANAKQDRFAMRRPDNSIDCWMVPQRDLGPLPTPRGEQ